MVAVGYREWIVRPHGDIEILASNLWRVEGVMNAYNRRVMVLARLADGRIVMHNAIALEDQAMAKIDAWGEVAAILVPNGLHRQDAFIMQKRYPRAKVYAPRGAMRAASKATPCAGSYGDAPNDETVSLREIEGIAEREGVMLVRSADGVAAVFCDTLLNVPKMSGFFGFMLHPTGMLSVPRATSWWFAKDRQALQRDLLRVAEHEGLVRVIPGHGAVVVEDAAARLREAAGRL